MSAAFENFIQHQSTCSIPIARPNFQNAAESYTMVETPRLPNLVASTKNTYCCSIAESHVRENGLKDVPSSSERPIGPGTEVEEDLETNYFKSTQWTPDGTSLLTSSADNTIRTFILPPTLLDTPSSPITLTPYTTHLHPTPINTICIYPSFTLSSPTTTFYLSTPSSLPIRLVNIFSPIPTPLSSYPLISPTTETYYTPSSLLFTSSTHFLAGTDCLIALFDISRNGEGPVTRMQTIPSKRHKMKGGGVGMRGIVSSLSLQPSPDNAEMGMLAAGTWTRWIGLYDMAGMGGTVATWSIASAADDNAKVGGTGVSQTLWSQCGRYLFVVERKSRGVLVYDVRVTGKLVAWLEGREADTNQRLGVDAFENGEATEVWAGGIDGVVRVWEGVGMSEGKIERSWEWKAHDDPITSTAIHSTGTVVATCSGQRSLSIYNESTSGSDSSDDEESSDEDDTTSSFSSQASSSKIPDNSIKVWSL